MTPLRVSPTSLLYLLVVLCLTAGRSAGQIDRGADGPVRWSEQAYGMSLTPPPGSVTAGQTQDGALAKFRTLDPATISVFIRNSPQPLDLKAVKNKALNEFAFVHPSGMPLAPDAQPVSPAGYPGIGLYMLVPDDKQGNWVFAQVFMLINPTTLAIFQLECDAVNFDRAQQTFKKMIDSVELIDPAELDRIRTRRLQAGQAWLDSITTEDVKRALVPEQWLRIVRGDKDVGYMRIRHADEARHLPPGTSVSVRSRIVEGNHTYDTDGTFFETDDRAVEFWTITTTRRTEQVGLRNPNTPDQPITQNWRQTGLRDENAIEVSQETPINIKKFPWTKPPVAYLSQVDLFTLPALLPRDKPAELAFYAFNQNARKLSLRTWRIEPLPTGGYRVHDRPTLDRGEQVATYDRTGKLLERKMPDGQTYLATTPQELKRIWGTLR